MPPITWSQNTVGAVAHGVGGEQRHTGGRNSHRFEFQNLAHALIGDEQVALRSKEMLPGALKPRAATVSFEEMRIETQNLVGITARRSVGDE